MNGKEREFNSFGVIIARTPAVHGNAEQAVSLGLGAREGGKDVGIFLLSDGVWNCLRGSGIVSEKLEMLIASGGNVYASGEHADAAGLPRNRAIQGVEFLDDAYDTMVDMIMEKWDKVIIC